MKRALFGTIIILTILALYIGCGIDEFDFIEPIPESNVRTSPLLTTVDIPSNTTSFIHYIILYRIYISDVIGEHPTPSDFQNFNPALSSHYNSINIYNPSSDRPFSASLLESQFRNRGYRYLRLFNITTGRIIDTENVLTESVLDSYSRLEFDFRYSNRPPKIRILNRNTGVVLNEYALYRSDETLSLRPADNLFFVNFEELYSDDNAVPLINGDTERNNRPNKGIDEFTYAAMYIVAVGLDKINYNLIYSNPTFIHAFPLPERL